MAYLEEKSKYYPVLESGKALAPMGKKFMPVNAPIIADWKDKGQLKSMAKELAKLSQGSHTVFPRFIWTARIRLAKSHFIHDGWLRGPFFHQPFLTKNGGIPFDCPAAWPASERGHQYGY